MSETRDQFQGDFIESADLMQYGEVTFTIASVVPPNKEKDATGKLIDRPIVAFSDSPKRFIVNKTNERLIKAMYGTKTIRWIDQPLTLTVRYLKQAFGEKNVPTLRVVLPKSVPMPFGCRKHYGAEQPHEVTP